MRLILLLDLWRGEAQNALARQLWTGGIRSSGSLPSIGCIRIQVLDLDITLLSLSALLHLLASVDVTCASASVSAISIAASVGTTDICDLRFGSLGSPVYSGADCYPCSCAGQKGWDGRLPETCSHRNVLSVAACKQYKACGW
jgi:hypothetical protein